MKKTAFYEGVLPELKAINIGIALLSTYIFLEFGSIQFFYDVIRASRLPFALALSCIIYVSILFLRKKLVIHDTLSRLFIIFCIFMIVHTKFTTLESGHAEQNIKLFVTFLANYIIIITAINKPSQYILLIDIWLCAIAYSSLHAFLQGGLIWGSQWLNDENQISAMLVTAIPFAFYLFINISSKLKRIIYAGCLLLYVAVTVVSFSRGGFVALLVVGFLCWLTTSRKIISGILVIVVAIGVFVLAPPAYFSEIETIKEGTQESTARARVYQWKLATHMFYDHPIFGVGPLNYPLYFSKYDQLDEARYYPGRILVLHSTPFTYLSETGLVGTTLIILIQILLFRNWRISISFNPQLQKDPDAKMFIALGNACAIAQAGFWTASIFLHLVPFPFFWILIPFSESLKRLKLDFVKSTQNEAHNSQPDLAL